MWNQFIYILYVSCELLHAIKLPFVSFLKHSYLETVWFNMKYHTLKEDIYLDAMTHLTFIVNRSDK